MVRGEEVAGELVEPRRDAPPVLDDAEEVFNAVTPPIYAFWAPCFSERVALAGNGRQGAVVADRPTYSLAVVTLVAGDHQWWPRGGEYRFRGLAVVHLSTRDDEVQRAAFAIDRRVNLACSTTATDADSLFGFPPLAPLAARCAFTTVLSIM